MAMECEQVYFCYRCCAFCTQDLNLIYTHNHVCSKLLRFYESSFVKKPPDVTVRLRSGDDSFSTPTASVSFLTTSFCTYSFPYTYN